MLGHCVYTSFGGYRVVFCSDWLQDEEAQLAKMAQQLSGSPGAWQISYKNQRWYLAESKHNGFDHVGRPRNLVHIVVLADGEQRPAIFSPAFLMAATLERLDNEDPALGHRLPQQLRDLLPVLAEKKLDRLVTEPQRIKEALSGHGAVLYDAMASSLALPDVTVPVIWPEGELQLSPELTLGLVPWWCHPQPGRVTNRGGECPPGWRQVVIGNNGTNATHRNLLAPGKVQRAMLQSASRPQLLLRLFSFLSEPRNSDLHYWSSFAQIVSTDMLDLDADGLPTAGPFYPRALEALAHLGGIEAVRRSLARWADNEAIWVGKEIELRAEFDQRLIGLREPSDVDALMRILEQEAIALHQAPGGG